LPFQNSRPAERVDAKRDVKALLAGKLDPHEIKFLYRSCDIVGDVAVIRTPESLKQHSKLIAEAVMQTHKRVKTVLRQTSPVSSDHRLRQLEWVAGERKTETLHKEYGCLLKVDLEKCYFSPRLSYERMRIARQVQPREVVVNMFAGVGSYSIIIAKHSEAEKVYSIDINPAAIQYMQQNIQLNKLQKRVVPLLGDAGEVIPKELLGVSERVLMPLPEKAYEYLKYAVMALKPSGGHIHYYDFQHAKEDENPVEKVKARVSQKLRSLGVNHEVLFGRVVRTVGPNWFQVVIDVEAEKS